MGRHSPGSGYGGTAKSGHNLGTRVLVEGWQVLNQPKAVRIGPGEVALGARREAGLVNQPIRFDTGRGLDFYHGLCYDGDASQQ